MTQAVAVAGRVRGREVARRLAGFDSRGHPVVSAYLDVDGRRHPRPADYQRRAEQLVRRAERRLGPGEAGARADLERVAALVRAGVDRSLVRGLVAFACGPAGLWEVVELPVPVASQLSVNRTPQLGQLEAVLEGARRLGVLIADRQRARMLVLELGEVVHRAELFDSLPRHEDDRGGRGKEQLAGHRAAAAQGHLRRSAELAFSVWRQVGYDHLVVGGPEETARHLGSLLHSYLRERLVASVPMASSASDQAVLRAALAVEEEVERAQEAEWVARVRDWAGVGRAVLGLGGVLAALAERRVAQLLYSPGFSQPGWRCPGCGRLALRGPSCALCGGAMDKVDDVVDEALAEALSGSCRVLPLAHSPDLDVAGRIAAVLRF
ncbi:MAG TPA: hypothetical protein VKY15_08750 [Acidimicrobiales bacterium]|nr:hypothetical protein [Acidimicrobiales bacterium]